MATKNIKARSGNSIRIVIDGTFIGMAQDLRGSDDYSPEPASGIGDIHVKEYVPTMARHTVTLSQMVMLNGPLRKLGFSAENGDQMLQGMVFDIVVQEKGTGTLLRKYTGCSFASGDIEVRKHAILMNNATFNALDAVGTEM